MLPPLASAPSHDRVLPHLCRTVTRDAVPDARPLDGLRDSLEAVADEAGPLLAGEAVEEGPAGEERLDQRLVARMHDRRGAVDEEAFAGEHGFQQRRLAAAAQRDDA